MNKRNADAAALYAALRQDGSTRQDAFAELVKAGYTFGQAKDAHTAYQALPHPVQLERERPLPDVQVENHGSVVRLHPLTEAGRAWFKANVHAEPWQWLGPALVVDHRFAGDLITGMDIDGLLVSLGN